MYLINPRINFLDLLVVFRVLKSYLENIFLRKSGKCLNVEFFSFFSAQTDKKVELTRIPCKEEIFHLWGLESINCTSPTETKKQP